MSISRNIETYISQSGRGVSPAAAVPSQFKVEFRFLGGLTTSQMNVFKGAADRWSRIITGDLPNVQLDGVLIDDLLIEAVGMSIDGGGAVLGYGWPTNVRPASAGGLPCKGRMEFDTADLASMESDGSLRDVITHEIGHVLGIGTIWQRFGLLSGAGTNNPVFTGQQAIAAYAAMGGDATAGVPVENVGLAASRDSHWRESRFGTELMTSMIGGSNNRISRMTVASLRDMGYIADMSAAEAYALPHAAIAGMPPTVARNREGPRPEIEVLPDSSVIE